jgi:hypothetical protein
MNKFLKFLAATSLAMVATASMAGHVSVGVNVGGVGVHYSEGHHGGYRGGYYPHYDRGTRVYIAPVVAPATVVYYDRFRPEGYYQDGYYRDDRGVEYVPTYCYDSWGRQYFCGYRP